MKRLLAALLTLSMMVSIVPFDAFADSAGATIVPNASATAQEDTSTPVLDENTVQAIISDPLLQGRYAPEQSQQTQPTVDTSDVTMEATDGFGKLLLNSINEQNDVSSDGNRIIGVSVSDNTAAVEYVTTTNADIVVSIYTDDSAEEMVASGTIYAPAMIENTGSSTVTVDISGTIPEYYTVKCYLLDTAEHAPLCKEYTDSSHTKVLVDIKNATVDDFESDRVINLDDNNSTNFAVVNPGVTLISSDDVPSNQNLLIENDTDNLNYTIDNATDDIKDLHTGSILTYEYEGGKLLIVRVKDIFVNGDTVTIHGDDSLTLEDVFTALKVETDAGGDELTYEASADDSVQYLGTTSADFSDFDVSLDEENSYELNGNFKVAHEFKILDKSVESPPEFSSDHLSGKASLSGTVKISASEEFKFYVGGGKTSVGINLEIGAAGTLTADGSAEAFVELASFGFSPVAGVYVGFVPRVVYKSSISGTVSFAITCPFGISYTKEDGLQNTSSKPTCKLNASIEGSIYIGLDFKPTVKILESVLNISLTTEAGATGTVKMNITGTELLDKEDSHHLCKKCFSLSIKGSINLNAELSLLKLPDLTFTLTGVKLETPEKKAYWAPDYHEFGWDDCPHNAYRVSARVITNDDITGSKIESYQDRKWVQIGEVKEKCDGYSETILYLTPGSYRLRVVVGDATYESADFTVDEDPLIETLIKTYVPDPDPGVPTPSDPNYTIENGKLTINNEKVMIDYSDASGTPWYGSRDKITSILTQYSVKTISNYAFADCSKVTEIYIGDEITRIGDYAFSGCSSLTKVTFVGTMAQWKALSIGIGNDILKKANIICSDGTIEGDKPGEITPPDDDIITSGICGKDGENLIWTLDKYGKLVIEGTGLMKDYDNNSRAPWHNKRGDIVSVEIMHGVTNVGSFAFFECYAIKDISICSTVTSIGDAAFLGCCGIKSITLPNNVAVICNSVFAGCDYLEEIVLSNSVTRIEFGAFQGCKSLKNITIPDTVTYIGSEVFCNCLNLTNITLPSGITEINSGLFSGCYKLANVFIPTSVTTVGDLAFTYCKSLEKIDIPLSVTSFGDIPFYGCNNLTRINYSGTRYQWHNQVNGGSACFDTGSKNGSMSSVVIYCTDGYITSAYDGLYSSDYELDGSIVSINTLENSISYTTPTVSGNNYVASFTGLTPGVNYAVIVSKSSVNPLDPAELIYVNQFKANDSGVYQQSFRTKSGITDADMTYVVAAGSYTFDDTPVTPGGGDSGSGGSSSGGSSGGGGGGGGAAVILGVGVAVAITAGVILTMPVDVQGRVELADHAAVPGAKVSLLKNGKVVTQTTADASGHFSLNAKRGDYELTVVYTDANGQFVQKTSSIKAPTKGFVVTF